MTTGQALKAAYSIDGYMTPLPLETREATFLRAKREAIFQLEKSLEHVESMSFGQYQDAMKIIQDAS